MNLIPCWQVSYVYPERNRSSSVVVVNPATPSTVQPLEPLFIKFDLLAPYRWQGPGLAAWAVRALRQAFEESANCLIQNREARRLRLFGLGAYRPALGRHET